MSAIVNPRVNLSYIFILSALLDHDLLDLSGVDETKSYVVLAQSQDVSSSL